MAGAATKWLVGSSDGGRRSGFRAAQRLTLRASKPRLTPALAD
jgi:hypothetical protein